MSIIQLSATALGIALCSGNLPALAATAPPALRQLVTDRLGTPVDSVLATPYFGWYEIQSGGRILYTDKEARFFFLGHVVDSATRVDRTAARLEEISKKNFRELPLKLAIKTVRGNGTRVLYLFEDPNCPYCSKMHQDLLPLTDVTIYTFISTFLGPDSPTLARNIWCSDNPSLAWEAWMVRKKIPAAAAAGCVAPSAKIEQLGQRLGVMGTPTVFFGDGSRLSGTVSLAGLEARLVDQVQRAP